MNLIIDQDKTIKSVQEDFQRHFPFLMIEFYSKPHQAGEGSPKKYQIKNSLTISEAQNNSKSGTVRIMPDMKVKDLENIFEEIFGLYVQIFRQSGKIRLQTITTDHLTLAEQNKMGFEMQNKDLETNEPNDYHEQL
jgi:hypothetical protein